MLSIHVLSLNEFLKAKSFKESFKEQNSQDLKRIQKVARLINCEKINFSLDWMQMEGRKTNLFVTVLEHFVNPGRVAEARNSAHPVRGKY